jgi:hypothetical protein
MNQTVFNLKDSMTLLRTIQVKTRTYLFIPMLAVHKYKKLLRERLGLVGVERHSTSLLCAIYWSRCCLRHGQDLCHELLEQTGAIKGQKDLHYFSSPSTVDIVGAKFTDKNILSIHFFLRAAMRPEMTLCFLSPGNDNGLHTVVKISTSNRNRVDTRTSIVSSKEV